MVDVPLRRLVLFAATVLLAAGSLAVQPVARGFPATTTQTTAEADGAASARTDSRENGAPRTANDASGEGREDAAGSARPGLASSPTESRQPRDAMPPRAPSLVVDEISVS